MTYRRKKPIWRSAKWRASTPPVSNQGSAIVRSIVHRHAVRCAGGSYRSVQTGYDLVMADLHRINGAPCTHGGPVPTMATILKAPSYSTFLRVVRRIEGAELARLKEAGPWRHPRRVPTMEGR